ncbi:MAG: hypothetical protein AB1489_41410 [Acidobacteriota bacterium]
MVKSNLRDFLRAANEAVEPDTVPTEVPQLETSGTVVNPPVASESSHKTSDEKLSRAKKGSPDYVQLCAYVRKSTMKRLKTFVISQDDLDISTAVEKIINEYLSQKENK